MKKDRKPDPAIDGPAFPDPSPYWQTASINPTLPTQDGPWGERCAELLIAATRLQEQLPPVTRVALAALVAHMNCYYSNLIEGHRTYPDEVETAVRLAADPAKSLKPAGTPKGDERTVLVAEALAHIRAQADLRLRLVTESAWDPATPAGLAWIHRIFYGHLPAKHRWTATRSGEQRVKIVPGVLRDRAVQVGDHLPPEVAALPAFLARFAEAYAGITRPTPTTIAMIAASHHRFAWIHPFVDGNGRVARLLTDALVERSGLGADGLWCVGRGFARQVERYRALLAAADGKRTSDTDGRGPRTQAGLDQWCGFVVEVMLDQVRFMHGLVRPATLRERILTWSEREAAHGRLHPRAGRLIAEAVCVGSVTRGEATDLLRLADRYGREQIRILIAQGYLAGAEREPLRPAFPLHVVPWWFPDLFPGDVEQRLVRP